jgi:hypothetical protein
MAQRAGLPADEFFADAFTTEADKTQMVRVPNVLVMNADTASA